MPFVGAGHEVHAVAHLGAEKDHLGLAALCTGELERLLDGLVVVSVGLDHLPAEGGPLVAQVADAADVLHGTVYLLAVPVGERHKVVQTVVCRPHACLPDLAFLALAVAKQAEHAGAVTAHLLSQGDSGGAGETLAEGTGALENARQRVGHARVSLQAGAELAERAKFLGLEVARTRQHGVIYRCQVAGGDDEGVLALGVTAPGLGIVLHLAEIQCGHYVGDAEGAARVPGLCGCNHTDDIPSHLRSDFS